MSDFVDALVELLPEHNSMKDPNNELRVVLNKCLGTWFDDHQVETVHDNVFFNSATGKYLDLFGNDYGVYRRTDESDDDYRNRILMEKLDYLTPLYLQTIYGLTLYAYVSIFDARQNCLTSDNPYLSNQYMSTASVDVQNILNNKFILGDSILWLVDDRIDNFIIDVDDSDLLVQYKDIYLNSDVSNYFNGNGSLKSVKLDLPNATNCNHMFSSCHNLKNVKLNLPKLSGFSGMFNDSLKIETIDVVIPTNIVTNFKSYTLHSHLENLTSFKINGEEQL